MRVALASLTLLGAVHANAADGQQIDVPLSRSETVAGVPVTFEGKVTYTLVEDICEPIPLTLVVHLDDLAARLTQIGKGSGLERSEPCGMRVAVHNALLGRAGTDLAVRVEGRVEREECIVIFGNKITTVYGSDVALEGELRPVIADGRLRTELAGTPRLMANDPVIQALVSVTGYDRQLGEQLAASIGGSLGEPTAALELPKELIGFQIDYRSARIDDIEGRLSLVVDAQAPRKQSGFKGFLDYLAGVSGEQTQAGECSQP